VVVFKENLLASRTRMVPFDQKRLELLVQIAQRFKLEQSGRRDKLNPCLDSDLGGNDLGGSAFGEFFFVFHGFIDA